MLLVVLMGVVLFGAVGVQADMITDTLYTTGPAERIANNFYIKYELGYGDDPLTTSEGYVATTTALDYNLLKYSAGAGNYFDSVQVSFVTDGQNAFQLLDANNQVVPVTQTQHTTTYWKWYTITADSDGYDFSELSLTVWGPTATGALGTVILDKVSLPTFLYGDANGDGVVSAADYAAVQSAFGNTLASQTTSTPEPATMSLLTVGVLALIRHRRKSDL